MFGFLRKSRMRSPSAALTRTLERDGLPPGTDISALGVVESRGTYAGRRVTFFRVFDPKQAAIRAVNVFTGFTYDDLDALLDLVLRAGFIEQDGRVVMSSRSSARGVVGVHREPANRAAHADVERFMVPDAAR